MRELAEVLSDGCTNACLSAVKEIRVRLTFPSVFLSSKTVRRFLKRRRTPMVAKVGMSSVLLLAGFCSQTLRAQEPAKPEAVVERPSCRYCPNPDYPLEARKAKIESASVLLEITVTEKGDADPQEIRVIEDPGHGFAEEAAAVLKKWKFKPATLKNGKPVKARVKVEVTFRDMH